MSDPVNFLGSMIKDLRKFNKISLVQLAELTNLSPSYISLIERNKRLPSLDILNTILKPLNVKISIKLTKVKRSKIA